MGPGQDWSYDDPRGAGADPALGTMALQEDPYRPPDKDLTILGLLQHLQSPYYPYFHHWYLKFLHTFLTRDWWCIQGGQGSDALALWLKVGRLLELDRKSMQDLLMLAQVVPVGRTKANKILWEIMTGPALAVPHRDMSHMVTARVYQARKSMDRPPREHYDLKYWDWSCYWVIPAPEIKWACHTVPDEPWLLYTEPGQKPVAPPNCFVLKSSQRTSWNTWS